MSKPLTAQDRSSLIKLASSMEKGSQERRAILGGLKISALSTLLSGKELLALIGTTQSYDLRALTWVKRHSDTVKSAAPMVKRVPALDLDSADPREISRVRELAGKAAASVGRVGGINTSPSVLNEMGLTAQSVLRTLRNLLHQEDILLNRMALEGEADPKELKKYEALLAQLKKFGAAYIKDHRGQADTTVSIQKTRLPFVRQVLKSLGVKGARYDKGYDIVKINVNRGVPGHFDSFVEISLSEDHALVHLIRTPY